MNRETDPAHDDEWWARKNDAQIDTRLLSDVTCGLCGKAGSPDWLDYQHRCGMRLLPGWKP